jgi:hypothetical protein
MNCIKCGATCEPDAKFCSMCGAGQEHQQDDKIVDRTAGARKARSYMVWLIIVGLGLIGMYAALFIPAFAGQQHDSKNDLACIFWTVVFFWLLWKQLLKKGWQGALAGLAVGFLVLFAVGFVSGLAKAKNTSDESLTAGAWKQNELTEQFMRSLTKSQCMTKTVASLKSGCSSADCLKTVGGIVGDCVTWARGDLDPFCASYDREYIVSYCDTRELDAQQCALLRVGKSILCKQAAAR